MKNIILSIFLVLLLISFLACKSNDPSLESLVGSWDVISYKTHQDSTLKELNTFNKMNVIFDGNGNLGSAGNTPFIGGWCNVAESYSLDDNTIYFQFGKANCIPLVDPKISGSAKIIEKTDKTLTIEWGQSLIKLTRR